MAQRKFPVLVAIDGSLPARAAMEAAVQFPWPQGSTGHGVIARWPAVGPDASPAVWEALQKVAVAEAQRAQVRLRRRWPDATVSVTSAPPVPGILGQARRIGARVIVVGSRGLGAIGRLFLGSVSRAVVREAGSSVLVVRGSRRGARRLLIGIDGSPHSRRAAAFVAGLPPPRGGQVRLLGVVEPIRLPSTGLLPAKMRAAVTGEAAEIQEERLATARRQLAAAQALLRRAGWRVRVEARAGRPLEELLAVAQDADTLVLGARGVGAMERLLLGSVAEGAVAHAPVPVLVVR
jgi:nucleotide-binding universal stress UspA family protein